LKLSLGAQFYEASVSPVSLSNDVTNTAQITHLNVPTQVTHVIDDRRSVTFEESDRWFIRHVETPEGEFVYQFLKNLLSFGVKVSILIQSEDDFIQVTPVGKRVEFDVVCVLRCKRKTVSDSFSKKKEFSLYKNTLTERG
jgi:hypothetical protein